MGCVGPQSSTRTPDTLLLIPLVHPLIALPLPVLRDFWLTSGSKLLSSDFVFTLDAFAKLRKVTVGFVSFRP